MPRIFDPCNTMEDSGYALASTASKMKGRRRRQKLLGIRTNHLIRTNSEMEANKQDIGEDLNEWVDEESTSKLAVLTEKMQKGIILDKKSNTAKRSQHSSVTKSLSSPMLTSLPPILPQKLVSAPSSAPYISSKHVLQIRHAVLVDSRGLDTEEGNKIVSAFLANVLTSLSRLARRGAAPLLLGCTCIDKMSSTPRRNHKSSRGALGATARRIDQSDLETLTEQTMLAVLQSLLPPISIRPPLNAGNVKQKDAVKLPIRLLANASWKIFVDLVEVAVEEDKKMKDVSLANAPLDVTIFTSDVAFFCDTNEEAHRHGVNRFWARVRDFFQSASIRSIEIVVFQTGSILLVSEGKDAKNIPIAEESEHMDIEADIGMAKSKKVVEDCLAMINQHLFERSKSDFGNRGLDHPVNPVAIKLSMKQNNSMGFNSLECSFIRRIFSRHRATVTFELPESYDGTQCAVCLEAKYKIMPFRADSAASRGLLVDLQLMTSSKFEVIQLVPLSCIDGSLMFGTPLSVTAAFDDDLALYTEMKTLLCLLLHHLCDRECAMLLRSTNNEELSGNVFGDPLYHSNNQTFILMAEEVPGKHLLSLGLDSSQSHIGLAKTISPSEAMLFRYATSEQIIDTSRSEVVGTTEENKESLKQLAEYVESSLEYMESNAVNPLLIAPSKDEGIKVSENSEDETSQAPTQQESKKDLWDDNAGVGSKEPAVDESSNEDTEKHPDLEELWTGENRGSTRLECKASLGNESSHEKVGKVPGENNLVGGGSCNKNGVVACSRGDNDDHDSEVLSEPDDDNRCFDYDAGLE